MQRYTKLSRHVTLAKVRLNEAALFACLYFECKWVVYSSMKKSVHSKSCFNFTLVLFFFICERESIVGQWQWSLREARRRKEPGGTD